MDHEMRVLTLQPSDHEDDEIHCKLEIVDRESAPMYTALSYAWGEGEPDSVGSVTAGTDMPGQDLPGQNSGEQSLVEQDVLTIKIKNSHFEVSRTLDAAIRRLRKEMKLEVWIDAICVIQDEENDFYAEDKNAQVYNMDKTYANASEVYIWLGVARPEEDSSLAMEAINMLGTQLNDFCTPEAAPTAPLDLHPINGKQAHEYIEAILKLVKNRKWFHRRWVIQEICLAPANTTLVCGRDEAPYWKLFLLQLHPKILEFAIRIAHGKPALQDSAFGEPPIGLTRLYFIAEGREPAKVNMGRCTLLSHLWNFRYRKCGVEKDRIYSLLGIARDTQTQRPDIMIDYNESKCFEEVFADATRKIISAYKTLDILGMCYGPDVTEEGVLKRPSWVPTFINDPLSQTVDSLTRYQWSETAFAATSGSNAAVKFPTDSTMLIVEGYRIGAIKQLATEDPLKWDDNLTKLREALKKALDWTGEVSALREDRYCDPIDAFWRTIITNRGLAAQKATEIVEGVQFRHWWDILVLQDMTKFTPEGNALAWKFQALFLQRWPCRDFFVTESGYIGMCGRARAYDDIVCLLPGSQVPFLLGRSKVETDRYWMVGECYVHDIMEGSLWREPEDWMKKEIFHIERAGSVSDRCRGRALRSAS